MKRHIEMPVHQKKLKDIKSMKTLNNCDLRKQNDTLKEQVIHGFLQPRLYGTVCKCLSHKHIHNNNV